MVAFAINTLTHTPMFMWFQINFNVLFLIILFRIYTWRTHSVTAVLVALIQGKKAIQIDSP